MKKKVLITAGPTYEAIDPVRFIGNRSSGKMGIDIANTFVDENYDVVLVLGPTSLKGLINTYRNIKVIDVESAQQMYEACLQHLDADIIIGAAAVADYKVAHYSEEKMKKTDDLTLLLERNVDILFEIGKIKKENQILVGFALETSNLIEYAKGKIAKKNLDIIVANYASAMNGDKNQITLINKNDLDNPVEHPEAYKFINAATIYKYITNYESTYITSPKAV